MESATVERSGDRGGDRRRRRSPTCCRGGRASTARSERSSTRTTREWVSKTYAEVGEIVRNLSLGLIDLGIEKGDKVAILANTRPEWTYFDFAALSAGATVVPIYQTNSPEECQYVLENSDAVAVIVEDDEQLEKIRQVRDRCPKLEHVIRMTGQSGDAISFDELAERGAAGTPRRLGGALQLGHPRRHLHLHLHVGDDRAAEGLRDHPRQLPRDARHGPRGQRRSTTTRSPTSSCRSRTRSRC